MSSPGRRAKLAMKILSVLLLIFFSMSMNIYSRPSARNNLDKTTDKQRKKLHQLQNRKKQVEMLNRRERDWDFQLARTGRNLELLEKQICRNRRKLTDEKARLEEYDSEILSVEYRYRNFEIQYEKRLRELYLKPPTSYFEMLVTAANPIDFVMRYTQFINILKADAEMLNTLDTSGRELVKKRQRIYWQIKIIEETSKTALSQRKYLRTLERRRISLLREIFEHRNKALKGMATLENITLREEMKLQNLIRKIQAREKRYDKIAGEYRSHNFIRPVKSHTITSPFGWREHPVNGKILFHTGVDYSIAPGEPVRASESGRVIFSGKYGGCGNTVIINHGNEKSTLYARCSRLDVYPGQTVKKEQIIALAGSTGTSTGPHLHFEIREKGTPVNPADIIY